MRNIFRSFALSFSLLSAIPFFRVHTFFKGINGLSVMFYPLVGLILGLLLLVVSFVLTPYFTQTYIHIIIFALLIAITGALHLDGFADTIDGFYVKKQRAFEVMSDPSIGGMGVIFLIVLLILKVSTLGEMSSLLALPIVLMLARYNATLAIYIFAYVKKDGIAQLAKDEFNLTQLTITTLFVVSIVTIFNSLWLLAISLAIFALISLIFYRRYGGYSGDMYGFLIEVSELLLLTTLVVKV
ncbi:MAG: adenosylcobinamide-GDP ribazoletransferase [Helicobacteraceae bacterium]|nr:adenosylcobinamide-GDP ribazoletransferase [Helicobacteraceae bacterium]